MSIWTILFIVLLIAWIGGFTVFHAAGGLIHLLLVFAVISSDPSFCVGKTDSLSAVASTDHGGRGDNTCDKGGD